MSDGMTGLGGFNEDEAFAAAQQCWDIEESLFSLSDDEGELFDDDEFSRIDLPVGAPDAPSADGYYIMPNAGRIE